MKIHQIICDACGNEIDMEKGTAIGLFEFIKVDEKIRLDVPELSMGNVTPTNKLTPEKQVNRTSLDLCKKCAEKVDGFIKDLKNDE